jgi:hypothetical protein
LTRERLVLRLTQLWILTLIVGSLQPARPSAVLSTHRGLHYLAFAGTAFLLFLLTRNLYQQIQGAIAAILLGLSLEFLQHLLYHNDMEWHDVRDDSLAVLGAFALYRCLQKYLAWSVNDRPA